MLPQILLLVASLYLFHQTRRAFLCAAVYTIGVTFFNLILGGDFFEVLIGSVLVFAISGLYFWLLERFQGQFEYWLILPVGLIVLMLL